MKKFNVITGIPRSGSTLLCNILNQNPEFYAGSTSPLPQLVSTLVNSMSNSDEVKAALSREPEFTPKRLDDMTRSMVECWYQDKDGVVFDKSRGWSFNALLLEKLFPEVKIITCVRDLRSVFGSVEKQHRKNPVLDPAASPNAKTLLSRADTMMAPEGIIGQCVLGTNDLMARMSARTFVVHYEAFTMDPRTKMQELYTFLGEPYFDHDFDNVQNTSEDMDALYLDKFPHEGHGKVTPTNRHEWTDYVNPELGQMIYQRYPNYNSSFGYQ